VLVAGPAYSHISWSEKGLEKKHWTGLRPMKVLDVTVIRIFAKKSSLAVNRRAISDIALAEDARVGLG
jgi:hypothetical protein